MSPIDLLLLAIGITLTGVLAWASVSDIRFRLIPNRCVLAVLGLFFLWSLAVHGAGLVSALEAAGIAFAVTVVFYALGIMGAGDAKLFSAVALFAGLAHLPLLTLATVMTGGVIAMISLASRPTRALVMFSMRGKGDFGRGVPYGVAIAAGGVVTMFVLLSLMLPLPWSLDVRHGLSSTIL